MLKYLYFIVALSLIVVFTVKSQEKELSAPEGWRPETIELPLSFAPDIPITGIEEVRFAPGWGEPESKEYFTYAFVWLLEEQEDFKKEDLQNFLGSYFDGLMGMVGEFEEVGTEVQLEKLKNGFEGQLVSKDGFFTKEELKLNLSIEKLNKGRIWFFRLSPQPMDHEIWKALNEDVRIKG